MGNIKTHTFNGVKYRIVLEKLDGFCDIDCDTDKDRYWLIAQKDLSTLSGLETVIHEALHACNWKATEDRVENTASDIARLLWRIGYRKKKR